MGLNLIQTCFERPRALLCLPRPVRLLTEPPRRYCRLTRLSRFRWLRGLSGFWLCQGRSRFRRMWRGRLRLRSSRWLRLNFGRVEQFLTAYLLDGLVFFCHSTLPSAISLRSRETGLSLPPAKHHYRWCERKTVERLRNIHPSQ